MTDVATNIEKKLEEVIQRELGDIKLDRVEIKSGKDHDGDLAVFITATLAPKAPVTLGKVSALANVAATDVFEQMQDNRLIYLSFRRPDDDRPDDELVPPGQP